MNCHGCGAALSPDRIHELRAMVASDCQPVSADVVIAACDTCGLVQKPPTAAWQAMCDQIYANYRIYHQAAGQEQKVRGALRGTFAERSQLLTEFLDDAVAVGGAGTVIDIGCGNGAFLRAFRSRMSDWGVVGAELNETFRDDILAIATDARFLTSGELEGISERFDLLTLIHCIEHIPDPVDYLAKLRRLMGPASRLVIQVPDAELNPFDQMIADHASHFSKAALRHVVERAGFEVEQVGNIVLGKEITLVARPAAGAVVSDAASAVEASRFLERNLGWIRTVRERGETLAQNGRMGIFGSSIAASWLATELGDRVAYFVDEDQNRVGREHLGRPILGTTDIPAESTLFVALEPRLAALIGARLSDAGVRARIEVATPVSD